MLTRTAPTPARCEWSWLKPMSSDNAGKLDGSHGALLINGRAYFVVRLTDRGRLTGWQLIEVDEDDTETREVSAETFECSCEDSIYRGRMCKHARCLREAFGGANHAEETGGGWLGINTRGEPPLDRLPGPYGHYVATCSVCRLRSRGNHGAYTARQGLYRRGWTWSLAHGWRCRQCGPQMEQEARGMSSVRKYPAISPQMLASHQAGEITLKDVAREIGLRTLAGAHHALVRAGYQPNQRRSSAVRKRQEEKHAARWRHVAEMRRQGMTLAEIGQRIGVSKQRVSQLVAFLRDKGMLP